MDTGLAVGEWVDAGQFLGIEDDIGCASGPHVHHEVGVPDDPSNPIDPVGGYLRGDNLVPKVCGIAGQRYVAGTTYTVPVVRPGEDEYSRHGVPDDAFQADFDALRECGYRLDWLDGFERDGQAYFNAVWHPNTDGTDWLAHRRLTRAELTARIEDYVDDRGYELVHVDVYNVGDAVRYAAIFERGASIEATHTYHGVDAAGHQRAFDLLTESGWRPRVVSATSVDGERTYAAIYTRQSIGSYLVRSFLTATDFQSTATANEAAGRRLIYLNGRQFCEVDVRYSIDAVIGE